MLVLYLKNIRKQKLVKVNGVFSVTKLGSKPLPTSSVFPMVVLQSAQKRRNKVQEVFIYEFKPWELLEVSSCEEEPRKPLSLIGTRF